jgi:hypothetical protein
MSPLRRGTSHQRIGPLHLAVERYVHCPRGALARLDRCEACDLMQGMMVGDRLEVLCGYPEPVPAVSARSTRGATHDAHGAPAAPPAAGGSATATGKAVALIFESDWPDD